MMGMLKFHCKNGKERGVLVLYILYSLKNKPKSGYEILKEIEEKTKGEWVPSKGTLYPLLKQLEEDEMIKISSIGKRSKSVYELTDKGKETIKQIRKYKAEARKKFMMFRELFIDILGKDKSDIEGMTMEIRDVAYKKYHTNKKRTEEILKKCLSELKGVD